MNALRRSEQPYNHGGSDSDPENRFHHASPQPNQAEGEEVQKAGGPEHAPEKVAIGRDVIDRELVEGSVVEAQQSGALIAGEVRDIGPMRWGLLHGLVMSDQLVADGSCQCEASCRVEDVQRVLALALNNVPPQ